MPVDLWFLKVKGFRAADKLAGRLCRVPQECPPEVEALIAACLAEDPAARPSAKDLVGLLSAIPASLVLKDDKPTATSPSGAASLGEGSEKSVQGLGIADLVGRGVDGGFDRLSASAPVLRSGGNDPVNAALDAAVCSAEVSAAAPAPRSPAGLSASISAPPGMRAPSAERAGPTLGIISSADGPEAASSASSDQIRTDPTAGAGAEQAERMRVGAVGGSSQFGAAAPRRRALCDSAYGSADEQGGCAAAAADPGGECGARGAPCAPADAPDQARLPDQAPAARRRAPPRVLSPFAEPGGAPGPAEPPGHMAAVPAPAACDQAAGAAHEQAPPARRRAPPRVPSQFAEPAGAPQLPGPALQLAPAAPGAGSSGTGPSEAGAAVTVASTAAEPEAGAASRPEAAAGATVATAVAQRRPPPRIASPFAAPDCSPPPQAAAATSSEPRVGGSRGPAPAPAAGSAVGSAGHAPARRQPPPRLLSPFAAQADAPPQQVAAVKPAEADAGGGSGPVPGPAAESVSAGRRLRASSRRRAL